MEGRTVLGDGGGVCQDSTTLFRAVLSAGLPVIERRAHAYRVGYYEQNSPPVLMLRFILRQLISSLLTIRQHIF